MKAKDHLHFLLFPVLAFLTKSPALLADQPDPPLKWGEIPMEQLKMVSYRGDSNATALVLCDYGNAHFNDQLELVFEHHVRVKILTKAGFNWGTKIIHYYSKDHTQRVRDIQGMTVSLDSSGKVLRQELKSESIFEENGTNGWENVRFTLPGLTPGCVVEYRYTIYSSSPFYIPDWSFQTTEPVLWSEYRLKTPQIFGYSGIYQGYQKFVIQENSTNDETFMRGGRVDIIPVTSSRWAVKNAPAIREEPYMTTASDYTTRVIFQLSSVTWPGERTRMILNTWDKVAEQLMDSKYFGKKLDAGGDVEDQSEALTSGIADSLQRLVTIYDFVRNTIVWNERRGWYSEVDLDDILESKTGSSADINMLLIAMLREAGIKADPVLLSTRDNGRIQKLYPLLDQFNYVICRAIGNGKPYLLDATDRLRPYTLLPERALNHVGWLIEEEANDWVDIGSPGKMLSATLATMTLKDDGSLSGHIQEKFSEYSALHERQSLAKQKPEEYMKALLKSESMGITLDTFSIGFKDSLTKPLVVDATVSSQTYAQILNDFIYINPVVVDRSLDNPFKLVHRTFPVDFSYPLSGEYTVILNIPESYAVKECPKSTSVRLSNSGGLYSRMVENEGTSIQIRNRFEIKKTVFNPGEYGSLRNMFQHITSLEDEQIVLQRKPVGKARK